MASEFDVYSWKKDTFGMEVSGQGKNGTYDTVHLYFEPFDIDYIKVEELIGRYAEKADWYKILELSEEGLHDAIRVYNHSVVSNDRINIFMIEEKIYKEVSMSLKDVFGKELNEGLMGDINNCETFNCKSFIKHLKKNAYETSDMEELAELFKKEYTLYKKVYAQKTIEVVDYLKIIMDCETKRKFVKDLNKDKTVFACDIDDKLNVDDILDYYKKM